MVSFSSRTVLSIGAIILGAVLLTMSAFISTSWIKTQVAPGGTTQTLSLAIPPGAPAGSTISAKVTATAGGQEESKIVTVTVQAPQCSDGIDNDDPEDTLVDADDPGCQKFFTGEYTPLDNSEADFAFRSPSDDVSPSPTPYESFLQACNDGKDNDINGLIDYPADPGCINKLDVHEGAFIGEKGGPICGDGIDNDGDGKSDCQDPGCHIYEGVLLFCDPEDNDEHYGTLCDDGIDNDGDNKIDWPADPDCIDYSDNAEFTEPLVTAPVCSDGKDNDGDNKIDWPADPDCVSSTDTDESSTVPLPACRDGIDNDSDTYTDYPIDPGCLSPEDLAETDLSYICDDSLDNDGDGFKDYPHDDGCFDPWDATETFDGKSVACSDGVDNDGNGKVDFPNDPGCIDYNDVLEYSIAGAQCRNGTDDDGDSKVDYPADSGCSGPEDTTEYDGSSGACRGGGSAFLCTSAASQGSSQVSSCLGQAQQNCQGTFTVDPSCTLTAYESLWSCRVQWSCPWNCR